MAESWLIRVYDNQQLVCMKECAGPTELGRQDASKAEELYELLNLETGGCRLVIALNDEISVSRQHARVVPREEASIGLRNLSGKVSFTAGNKRLGKTRVLKPGQTWDVELPAFIEIGKRVVRFQAVSPEESADILQSLEAPT